MHVHVTDIIEIYDIRVYSPPPPPPGRVDVDDRRPAATGDGMREIRRMPQAAQRVTEMKWWTHTARDSPR